MKLTRDEILKDVRDGIKKFLMDEHCAHELAHAVLFGGSLETLSEYFSRHYATDVGKIWGMYDKELEDWYNECHLTSGQSPIQIVASKEETV
jgi:hypothetical protein